ncbi:endoribonuclease SymE [Erwinia sp.]|uniref:endoribonuclease SymE n=1 Tax=Erwinia citreus TaxID=558 RepID=UPI003C71CBF0
MTEAGAKNCRYTAGNIREAKKFEPSLSIVLEGHWPEAGGVVTEMPDDVKVLPGCQILSVQEQEPTPPPEPEVVGTLRRACKNLSASKQQQVAEFIQVIATPQKRPRKIPEGTVEWRRLD